MGGGGKEKEEISYRGGKIIFDMEEGEIRRKDPVFRLVFRVLFIVVVAGPLGKGCCVLYPVLHGMVIFNCANKGRGVVNASVFVPWGKCVGRGGIGVEGEDLRAFFALNPEKGAVIAKKERLDP